MLDKKFVLLIALVLGAALLWFRGSSEGGEDLAVGLAVVGEAHGGGAYPALQSGGLDGAGRAALLVEDASWDAAGVDEATEAAQAVRVVPFFGRIVERGTGVPIAGVALAERAAVRLAEGVRPEDELAVSDGDGRFELTWSEDAPRLAMAPGFGVAGFYVDGEHIDPGAPWVIEMERSGMLVVRLEGLELDGSESLVVGTPGYNLTRSLVGVTFSGPGRMFLWDARWSVAVDAGGVAEVELPARTPLALRLGPATYPQDITLEPGERRELVWRLKAGGLIDGQLVDELGVPVVGAEVWLCRSPLGGGSAVDEIYFSSSDGSDLGTKTRSDGEGHFVFEDITPGTVWIGPAALGQRASASKRRSYSRTATRVVVPSGVERMGVKLVAHRGLVVGGRVVLPGGEQAFVRLRLTPEGGRGSLSMMAEPDGTFLLGPLMPGAHELRVSIMRSSYVVPEPIRVFPGDEGLVIEPVLGGSIAGVVRDAETGEGLEAALWRSGGPDATIAGARAGADGSFRIEGLVPGTYHLGVVTGRGRAGGLDGITVGLGESLEGLEIELGRTGRVTVYYSGSTEYGNYYVRSGQAVVAVDGLHDGTEATKEVPVGRLVVEMKTRDGKLETREIEVGEGEEVRVAFDLNGD